MFSEFQQVLSQGGPILWALILIGVGLYTILASTWLGLRKVKRELGDHHFEGDDRRHTVRQFVTFELDRLAWVERRLSAVIQFRWGPNRVGPFGVLQPFADGIKFTV